MFNTSIKTKKMEKLIKYAKKRLELICKNEIDANVIETQGGLYLEFRNGMNFQLSHNEIKYQATLYLESEIEHIKTY